METAHLCLQPTYVKQFRCDGSQCHSKCCRRWLIEIDGNTYQKYCGIKSREERKKITDHIKWKKNQNAKKFVIMLRKDGSCPFLREDGFCDIQKKYGENFLSKVCASYPRVIHQLDDIIEQGMTLSCPVAAKQILLQEEPIEFEQIEFVEHRPMYIQLWDKKRFRLGDYLIDLQYSCISILQNRKLSLDQRLILMGFFLEQADELAEQGHQEEIRALAEGYASERVADVAAELTGGICRCSEDYLRCMFGMVETLYGKGTQTVNRGDQEYLDALTDLYQMSEEMEVVSMTKLRKIYESYAGAEKEILQQYSYVFENCMVNELFSNQYPLCINGTLTENYLYFLMNYKLMEFFSIVLAVTRNNQPKAEVLAEGLSFFAGRIDHSPAYASHILEEIQRYHKDMAFFMRTLLDGRV